MAKQATAAVPRGPGPSFSGVGPWLYLYAVEPWCPIVLVSRYTDLSFTQARDRLGWEWIVEAALRKAGYAPAHNATRPAPGVRPLPVTGLVGTSE